MPLPPPGRAVASKPGFDLGEFGTDALESALSVLNVPLEILSRPSYALSEGVGAARAGADPLQTLGASWRGLSGGRRRYKSTGEQLFPEDELASIATDLIADPLMFIPAGKAVRGGAMLVRGTGLGKKLGKGAEAVGKTLRGSKALQGMAEYVLPAKTQLGIFGRKYGKAIGLKSARARDVQALENARRELSLVSKLDELGLDTPEGSASRELAGHHVRSGGARTGRPLDDPKAEELARFARNELEAAADEIEAKYSDIFPEFSARRLEDYWPQMLKQEFLDALENGDIQELQRIATATGVPMRVIRQLERGPSAAAENLAKMLGISVDDADNLWRFNTGRPMKAGHIELERVMTIPPGLLEMDVAKVLPRYFNQLNRRVAYAIEFGKDFEKLEDLLTKAKRAGLSESAASEIRQAIRDPVAPEGRISKEFARKLMGAMAVTKMGITSTVMNSSQGVNSIVRDGGTNFVLGLFRSTNREARERAVTAWHFALKENLEHAVGDPGKPLLNVPLLKWITPERYLKGVLFTPVEKVNRIMAANSGVVAAERLARKAVQAGRTIPTKELVRRGVSREEFNYFRRYGELSDKGKEWLGLKAANATQHSTSYLDIPLAWRSPEMRIMMQYKSFIYQQSRFLAREVMVPAAKYFAGSPDGDIMPLLRAAAAFGIAGEATAAVRAMIRGEDKRRFDANHPLQQLFRDASYVGAFGMASDIVDSALRGKVGDYVLGPTIGEASDIMTDIARFAKDPEMPTLEEISKQIYRRVGRGPLPFLNRALGQ